MLREKRINQALDRLQREILSREGTPTERRDRRWDAQRKVYAALRAAGWKTEWDWYHTVRHMAASRVRYQGPDLGSTESSREEARAAEIPQIYKLAGGPYNIPGRSVGRLCMRAVTFITLELRTVPCETSPALKAYQQRCVEKGNK